MKQQLQTKTFSYFDICLVHSQSFEPVHDIKASSCVITLNVIRSIESHYNKCIIKTRKSGGIMKCLILRKAIRY